MFSFLLTTTIKKIYKQGTSEKTSKNDSDKFRQQVQNNLLKEINNRKSNKDIVDHFQFKTLAKKVAARLLFVQVLFVCQILPHNTCLTVYQTNVDCSE